MTRFNISLDEGVNMVIWALDNAFGGELFVPKIPSYRISDVAEAISPSRKINCNEEVKRFTRMITSSDSIKQ